MFNIILKVYRKLTGKCTSCGTPKVVYKNDMALCYKCDDV